MTDADASRSVVEAGTLYVVPTPIGNLADMTFRAIEVLKGVDLIACEDTRTTGVLAQHFDISTPRTSFHAHNEHGKADRLATRIESGESVAVVSDAGTPGISDPGFMLVRACVERSIPIVSLPGATAFAPALVASGLPCDRFVFEGFLPPKKGRKTRLELLAQEPRTVILYESPHRIERSVRDLAAAFGEDRRAVLAREISKRFEEVIRGTLGSIHDTVKSRVRIRGELVLVIAGTSESDRLRKRESASDASR